MDCDIYIINEKNTNMEITKLIHFTRMIIYLSVVVTNTLIVMTILAINSCMNCVIYVKQ